MTKYWLSLMCLVLLAACQQNDDAAPKTVPASQDHTSQSSSALAARINDQEVTVEQLDEPLRLALYDLEWQIYKLRKARLNQLVEASKNTHGASGSSEPFSAELLLEPPFPPRLTLPIDERPVKGFETAPVRLSIFCSYQSSHCARLQLVLETIESYYGDHVSFAYYDFPQGFHRYARSAANAVRCAADQQSDWDFQSSVYGAFDDLSDARYILIGRQLDFDDESFKTCLVEKTYADAVEQDITLSQSLGFGSVPIVLVNGLYIKGPQSFAAYQYYIDHELDRLGVKRGEDQPLKKSNLPLKLQGTLMAEDETQSRAIIEFIDVKEARTFNPLDEVLAGVILMEIHKDRIIVDNDGSLEYIVIQQSYGQDGAETPDQASDANLAAVRPNRVRAAPENRALPSGSKVTLSRVWLIEQLAQQDVLAGYFQAGEHKASGYNLMKLDDVSDSEFYKTLGLRTGDVIMQVNDEWLHSGQNPLWSTLSLQDEINVTVMRGGRPLQYSYRVKD